MIDWRSYIAVDPRICHGASCIKGTRILVSVVLDNLAEGRSVQDIVQRYPTLTADAVLAAAAYGTELARERVVDPPHRAAG